MIPNTLQNLIPSILVLHVYVASTLPVVDKGVFVITGVKTCREGYGYCILGTDCTVDKEFIPDDKGGHCEGLKKAFTPRAFFVCCQSLENSTIITPPPPPTTTTTTTTTSSPLLPSLEEDDEEDNSSSNVSGGGAGSSNEDSGASGESNESVESSLYLQQRANSSTTTVASVIEEVHTEISVSEDFHVDLGSVVGNGTVGMGTGISTTTSKPVVTMKTVKPTTTESSSSVDFKQTCGYKATFYNANSNANVLRVDGSRLAAQQTSLVCWTGAIVRSPSSLTLQDPGSFICTGALITEEFLLTTATCVSRLFAQDLSLFKVALGSRHLVHPMNGPTPDASYRDIEQLIVHEDYNIQGLFKRVNDIALVRLSPSPSNLRTDEHLSLNPKNASPYCTVCLPDGVEDHSGEDCIVTGYSHPTGGSGSSSSGVTGGVDEIVGGVESSGGVNISPSAHDTDGILHEADQRIEYSGTCETQLSNFTVAQNTLLRNDLNIGGSKLVCAAGKFNAEACFSPRDAGSPLACPSKTDPDQYRLVGVFSSGFHCGTSSSPVLYTDVSKFVGWVRGNIQRVLRGGS